MAAVFVLSLVTAAFLLGFARLPALAILPVANAAIAGKGLWESQTIGWRNIPATSSLRRLRDAIYGGLLGGCMGGAVLAVSYFGRAPSGQQFTYSASILAAAMFVGAFFSGTFHLGILIARIRPRRSIRAWVLNELTGAVFAGMALGSLLGAPLGIVFGSRHAPFVTYNGLIISVPLTAMCIGIFSVGYGQTSRLRQLVPSLAMATLAMIVVPVVLGLSFPWFFFEIFLQFGQTENNVVLAEAGSKLGACAGGVIGLQVGSAMLIDRLQIRRAAK